MYSTIIHYKINDLLGFGVHQSEDPTDGVILPPAHPSAYPTHVRCSERAMANPLEHRFRQPWVEHLGRLREVERDVASRTTGEDLALRYSVPRIVCIGEESSGSRAP